MCGILILSSEVDESNFNKSFKKIQHRGPDSSQIISNKFYRFGFHRLAIMDTRSCANQPFILGENFSLTNGEIYNFESIIQSHQLDHTFQSESDCEFILPFYLKHGIKSLLQLLDGEFAVTIWDHQNQKIIAARDPIGIRPLFYGFSKKDKRICFSSEVKGLIEHCLDIKPFPPGHYFDGDQFVCYKKITARPTTWLYQEQMPLVLDGIKTKLTNAVVKRLHASVPLGFLLSGGLDSSLVCAIAQKNLEKPIKTFAVGMHTDAIDLKYAKTVAEFLGTDHTEVKVSFDEVLSAIHEIVYALETWDITTIRASIGMFLLCRYIRKNTKIRVILTGEVSDELFGYKYTDFAPGPEEFQLESQKRVDELYMYDVLRADRCIAYNSLEARVPFSDSDFVEHVLRIDPKLKMNIHGKGKYLLRQAFANDKILPDEILWREKAAFSDGVGHSLVDSIKQYTAGLYTEDNVRMAQQKYPFATPFSAESLFYREVFESYYPGHACLVKGFWMPNETWPGCKVNDPSARVLANYGGSGV